MVRSQSSRSRFHQISSTKASMMDDGVSVELESNQSSLKIDMNDKPKRTDRVEVSSDQLKAELTEIKERVGALETIASISNGQVVEAYVRQHLKGDKGKQIMTE